MIVAVVVVVVVVVVFVVVVVGRRLGSVLEFLSAKFGAFCLRQIAKKSRTMALKPNRQKNCALMVTRKMPKPFATVTFPHLEQQDDSYG